MHAGPIAAGPIADAAEKFRKGADVLFAILIAVSLENAVERFLHLTTRGWAEAEAPHAAAPAGCVALLRLIVFASLVANFYFGSIKFFERTYSGLGDPSPAGFGKRFRVDVFSGLIHFGFFYGWSVALSSPETISFHFWGLSGTPFLLMLLAVLVWDLVWLVGRWLTTLRNRPAPWNTRDPEANAAIWGWTWKNLVLAGAAIILAHFAPVHPLRIELIASVSAMALNVWEFSGIVS